jgi:NAD(P)-dependent dehydrogenase (short-subunit alcohol dehydrogenase family)
MNIKGLAAVVTGGATGMGGAAAAALANKGAKVSVLARRRETVETKAREIGGLGLVCDISNPDDVAAAFDAAENAHGPARVCINCAAYCTMARFRRRRRSWRVDSKGVSQPTGTRHQCC